MQIRLFDASRDTLLPLFAEADDSESQIESYKDLGEVLTAHIGDEIVGLALIVRADDRAFEVKSLAVLEEWRSQGIGAALIQAAGHHCRDRKGCRLVVATAAASIQALQFYQRQGFRMLRVIRDFYVPERGYRPVEINGIPLLDEVILDLEL